MNELEERITNILNAIYGKEIYDTRAIARVFVNIFDAELSDRI